MPVFTKDGFGFYGWTSVNGGKVPNITFPYTPTADIVLYPVFHKTLVTSAINTSDLEIDASDASNWDITIANGGVLIVTETTVGTQFNFRSITIKGGGRLVIPSGTYIATSKLIMEGGDADASDNYLYRYPQLVANGKLNVSGNVIYYDCLLNKKQQYLFCLPGNVNVADITYADGSPAVLGTNYKVACYNGAARATGALGWEYIPNNTTTLTAGKGYTIFANPQYYQYGGTGSVMQHAYSRLRFPIAITANYTETDKAVPVSAYPSATGKDNDAGWNFVGNPYFANFSNNSLGLSYQASDGIGLLTLNGSGGFDWTGNQRYVVHISDDGKSYYSELATAATLSTFKSLFVQIGAQDAAALSFPIANRRQNLLAKNVEEDILMTGITLSQSANTANVDRLGVLVGDNFTDAYEINADLQKLGHNVGVNLYAWMRSSELAFVAVNEAYAANAIPVGFIAPQAGEYSFSLDSRYDSSPFSAVILYDSETKQSTDLLTSNYKFSVSKAQTNNTRFVLSLNVRADMPTAIGNVAALEQGQVVKSLVNGNLVIRANGGIYNAQGAVLK